jgi:2-dehydropantoate 2-reductase
MEKVMFLGMGAIGASFAAQLKDGGVTPVVLCDEKRKSRYSKDGFIVNNKHYDFEYILPSDTHYTADIIFLAVKHHHLKESVEQMKNFIDADTIIVSLMNGIDSEMIIGKHYGMNHIVHAYVIAIDAVREKNIINFEDNGQIVFGNSNGIEDNKTDFIKHLFNKTGVTYKISDEILKRLWWKFMLNVGLNQVSSILDAPYGVFTRSNDALELTKLAMKEVIELSKAMNINLDESAIDQYISVLNNLAPEGITSMLQDVRAKRKTEVEMLSGQVIEFGKKYGVDTPVNNILYKMIRTIEFTNEEK